jgi:hypothetical protein
MKEEDYVMKIMATYWSNYPPIRERMKARRTVADGSKVQFESIKPIANHFDYQHCVDDNNHLHHICGRQLKRHGRLIDGCFVYLLSFLLFQKLVPYFAFDNTGYGAKMVVYISMLFDKHYQWK